MINNYGSSYLDKNRSDTNVILIFDFDSYLHRLILEYCMFRNKICVEFDSQTNYLDSIRIIRNKNEEILNFLVTVLEISKISYGYRLDNNTKLFQNVFIIFTKFIRILAERKSVSINYGCKGLFDSNHLYSDGNLIIIFSILVVGIFVILLDGQFLVTFGESVTIKPTNNKVVILNFDDNRKSQFTQVKPVLDKYGFKATFYVVCKYLDNKKGFMNWTELETLYKEGHNVGSHTMNHANLSQSSKKSLEYQIGQSKECLQEHGINATSFAYPFDKGSDNKTVINIVSKYYELARTASSPLTYLHCDGWKDKSNQTDCRTYTNNGKLNYANQYSIRGWSHDLSRRENSYDDPALYDRFIQVVNSQSNYNMKGTIKAIPIIIYHRAGDKGTDYNTDLDLFDKEMKYLHNGNFTVLTMADLGYDKKSNYLYVK